MKNKSITKGVRLSEDLFGEVENMIDKSNYFTNFSDYVRYLIIKDLEDKKILKESKNVS